MYLKRILALCILMAWIITAAGCSSSVRLDENRAVIIDQLNPSNPDPDFICSATELLRNNRFSVDYYSGEQVNLDLYRRLPELGYHLVIFRAHSGLMGNGKKSDQKTCLFTNQPYRQQDALIDQLFNRVVKAGVDNQSPLFGVGADFVRQAMSGKFNGTIIVMMGCSSLEKDDLARAFIEKGASEYFGWNNSLGLKHSQETTLALLDDFLSEKLLPDAAVALATQQNGNDPESGAELCYFPVMPVKY